MGTIIETDGAFVGLPYGILLPVMSGARVWANLGNNQASSVRNDAAPNQPLTPVGAIAYSPTHVSLKDDGASRHVLDTQVQETADVTFFAVTRKTGSANARVITNIEGDDFTAMFMDAAGTVNLLVQKDGSALAAAGSGGDNTAWNLTVAQVRQGIGLSTFNLTDGVSGGGAMGARDLTNTRPWRIGGSYLSPGNGPNSAFDIAFAAIYDRALSDEEIGACAEFINQLMTAKGLPDLLLG